MLDLNNIFPSRWAMVWSERYIPPVGGCKSARESRHSGNGRNTGNMWKRIKSLRDAVDAVASVLMIAGRAVGELRGNRYVLCSSIGVIYNSGSNWKYTFLIVSSSIRVSYANMDSRYHYKLALVRSDAPGGCFQRPNGSWWCKCILQNANHWGSKYR